MSDHPPTASAHPPPIVLLVEDELEVRHAMRHVLEELGATVFEAATGGQALAVAAVRVPDLIVLDLGLPDMDGGTARRELRAWSSAPVLALASNDAERETLRRDGAVVDDCLTKPVGPDELAVRVRAQLRHAGTRAASAAVGAGGLAPLRVGDLVLDFDRGAATRSGRALGVTRLEWRILRVLAAHAGSTLTHQEIFDAVWAQPFGNAADYVRGHVNNLRRKIERVPSAPEFVRTTRGDGYRFEVPRAARGAAALAV